MHVEFLRTRFNESIIKNICRGYVPWSWNVHTTNFEDFVTIDPYILLKNSNSRPDKSGTLACEKNVWVETHFGIWTSIKPRQNLFKLVNRTTFDTSIIFPHNKVLRLFQSDGILLEKKYVNPTSFPFKQFNNETIKSLFVAFVMRYLPLIDFRNIWNLLRCVPSSHCNCRHLHSFGNQIVTVFLLVFQLFDMTTHLKSCSFTK